MVKSAENGYGSDRSASLDQPPMRRIFSQHEMGADVIVGSRVGAEQEMKTALNKVTRIHPFTFEPIN